MQVLTLLLIILHHPSRSNDFLIKVDHESDIIGI